jgi:hypothetical protein
MVSDNPVPRRNNMAPKEIPITNADINKSIKIPDYQTSCLKYSATSRMESLVSIHKHKG